MKKPGEETMPEKVKNKDRYHSDFSIWKSPNGICRLVEDGKECRNRVEVRGLCSKHRRRLSGLMRLNEFAIPSKKVGNGVSYKGYKIKNAEYFKEGW